MQEYIVFKQEENSTSYIAVNVHDAPAIVLGYFLQEMRGNADEYIKDLKDPKITGRCHGNYGDNDVDLDKEAEKVVLKFCMNYATDEAQYLEEINPSPFIFITTLEKIIDVIEQWDKIYDQEPKGIIIYKDNDYFIVGGTNEVIKNNINEKLAEIAQKSKQEPISLKKDYFILRKTDTGFCIKEISDPILELLGLFLIAAINQDELDHWITWLEDLKGDCARLNSIDVQKIDKQIFLSMGTAPMAVSNSSYLKLERSLILNLFKLWKHLSKYYPYEVTITKINDWVSLRCNSWDYDAIVLRN